jgi:hypothetical protein
MNALLASRISCFGAVALSFPVAAWLVFGLGWDRHEAANALAFAYAFGIPLALSTSFWPLAATRDWSQARRVESLALVFLGMSYFTHLSWELGWLVLHPWIAEAAESPWAYAWWAYIDGGDLRYARPDATLLGMETLSVINGAVGAGALALFLRSGRSHRGAALVLCGTAVVHLYSAALYYLTEILGGMPSVDTQSFVGTYIKFGLANLPWLVGPFFVFRATASWLAAPAPALAAS